MPEVKVIFSDAEYPDSLGELAQSLKDYPAVFVIADRAVRQFVTEPLAECCAALGVALRGVFDMRTGERFKTMKTVERIQRWLIGAGAGRDALIVAVR